MTIARVLRSITHDLGTWGIATNFHHKAGSSPEAVPVLAWVDDVAVCLESESHDHLVANLRNAVEIIGNAFSEVGLSLNLQEGKTEASIRFVGTGSKQANTDLHIHAGSTMKVIGQDGEEAQLNIVPKYKHLGSVTCPDMCLDDEVKRRIALASVALGDMRRGVFTNRGVATSSKAALLDATVLQKLFYGSQV